MRFLIFGDVVGRPGRQAVTKALPGLREEHKPDAVIINIENIAHGDGLTPATVDEALGWQANVYTTGDHAWRNKTGIPSLENKTLPIIRPANYPPRVPGRGYHVFSSGAYSVAVINLQGQVFFKNQPSNPFFVLDELLQQSDIKQANMILLDFHAEATSEKRAMGWYADGRVTAVWGTHTHVPTADAQILPKGTGFISDVGMVGSYHSNIGADVAPALDRFLTQLPATLTFESTGPYEVNALVLDANSKTAQTSHIALERKILNT